MTLLVDKEKVDEGMEDMNEKDQEKNIKQLPLLLFLPLNSLLHNLTKKIRKNIFFDIPFTFIMLSFLPHKLYCY